MGWIVAALAGAYFILALVVYHLRQLGRSQKDLRRQVAQLQPHVDVHIDEPPREEKF